MKLKADHPVRTELTGSPSKAAPEKKPAPGDPLWQLMRQAVEQNASDVHLRAGSPPRLRIDGELLLVKGFVPSYEMMRRFFERMLTTEQLNNFERVMELDFSHDLKGICRTRINLYQERGSFCASIRIIPSQIPTMQEIGLPPACEAVTRMERGLVLVTGPTGSGKSTTLAAMINHVNETRRCHILTVEDPIEYYFDDKRALVSQRALDADTRSFTAALRHSFRQDPDVVMIGEMRDLETMQTAISLAETGHLTFSTLHTGDTIQTISRIVDAFPPHQQDQIRMQLSSSLAAVISQRLLPVKGKRGRVAAREIMICNRAIRNLIRENKTNQIMSAIQTGSDDGMITVSASLAQLVKDGQVDYEVARDAADDPREFASKFSGH